MSRQYTGIGLEMDFKLFKDVIDELLFIGVKEIGLFFIGESFTAPDLLVKMTEYIKLKSPDTYVFLTSNASLAKHPIVYKLMLFGLDSLKWSCNYYNEEQFNKITGVKPSLFHDAINNIKQVYEMRERFNFTTKLYASSIRYDDDQLIKMEEFLSTNIIPYVDQHYWLPLYNMGSLSLEREKKLEMNPIAGNTGRYDNPVDALPCWTLFTEAHITSDFKVTACCMDATGDWVMGDLREDSFIDIWHSDKFRELRKAHLNKDVKGTKCENCIMYK